MDTTSDDPITLLIAGGAVAGAAAGGAFGGGPKIPKSVQAENVKRTAAPLEQVSETARRNRRLRASFLTRGFSEPKLGTPGLLAG